MPLDESLKIVRVYLIAATAKDLSMMICFRAREDGDVESPYRSVFLESANQTFDYKASFVDLDMKPLKKTKSYYELDQQIVRCKAQMVNGEYQVENLVCIGAYGTAYSGQSNTIEDHSENSGLSGSTLFQVQAQGDEINFSY